MKEIHYISCHFDKMTSNSVHISFATHLYFLKVEKYLLAVLLTRWANLVLGPGAEGARHLGDVPRGAGTTRRARTGALYETS